MAAKVLTVIGARPQFIKAAPVTSAIASRDGIAEVLVHTGQHFDGNMSDVFFDELGIPAPHHNLGIHGGSHGEMTGRMMIELEPVITREQPDVVLVYGDTNSTLAGALVAAKLNIPVAHVEAGLRAFRPTPEEINRVVADRLSHWLFCPTAASVKNLADEGITENVHRVGDVMYDAVLRTRDRARADSGILETLSVRPGEFQLATVHRAENTDTPEALSAIVEHLKQASRDMPLVLPLHPRTRQAAETFGISIDGERVITTDPVGYLDMVALLDGCTCVLTDSGGLQKEAYFHGKPCVTLRDTTEWVETIDAGWNRLWRGEDYRPRKAIAEYGDGDAAGKIIEILVAAA